MEQVKGTHDDTGAQAECLAASRQGREDEGNAQLN